MIRLKPKKKIPKSEAYWQTLAVLQKARLAAKKKVDGRFGSLFGIKVESTLLKKKYISYEKYISDSNIPW